MAAAAMLTDELMNIQKLLFGGYMRTEILMNFQSKLSNIITDDVIKAMLPVVDFCTENF